MKIVVTGANGRIGTALREHLPERYDATWLDRVDHSDYETHVADVQDYADLREAVAGADAIVHLAMSNRIGGPDSKALHWNESFEDVCREICNVFDAAREENVESVVFASSNRIHGMYELEHSPQVYQPEFDGRIEHDDPPRPDSRYSVAKLFGETMGRLAAEAHGIRCYMLRIGSVRPSENDHPYAYAERGVDEGEFKRGSSAYHQQADRLKAIWLSRRDAAQLVERCLADDSVSFDVFFGRSDSDRGWFDNERAKAVLGYEPRDDASEWSEPPTR